MPFWCMGKAKAKAMLVAEEVVQSVLLLLVPQPHPKYNMTEKAQQDSNCKYGEYQTTNSLCTHRPFLKQYNLNYSYNAVLFLIIFHIWKIMWHVVYV